MDVDVDDRRSQPQAGPELVLQAESLVRALDGVVHARIHAGDRGIDSIHVVASDDDTARDMAGHVRSALLAGLATPIIPARIHVRVAGIDLPAHDADDPDAAAATGARPRQRIRMLQDAPGPADDEPADPQPCADAIDADETDADADADADIGPGPAAEAGPEPDRPASPLERPRLVAVDVNRMGDGRVACRVSVAWDARVHRAEAVAVDLPGAAAHAAAQAAVRALVAAGMDGMDLTGLREVEIAGKNYVIVALRRVDDSRRYRSGSAPIIGSPERSAAEAAVDAAAQLI